MLIALVLVALVVSGAALWSVDEQDAPPPVRQRHAQLDVLDGPRHDQRIQIEATLHVPANTPAPAILLSHGFGQDQRSVAGEAEALAQRGFAVLTYSSRGFGGSTGQVALNTRDHEAADARQIVDWLARQPEVLRDHDGDPRVGATGDSYGGALSLLLAGTDPRIDAVAPRMTYNDLGQALLPNNASRQPVQGATPARGTSSPRGVFKQAWAGMLFASGARGGDDGPSTCGNFTPRVCAAYTEVARTGRAGPAAQQLLDEASPKSVTDRIKAPTLLVQGEQDSLFGLDQADATARQIARAGGDVQVHWTAGGHDAAPSPEAPNPGTPSSEESSRVADWFASRLGGVAPPPDPGPRFSYDVTGTPRADGRRPVRTIDAPAYPGIGAGPAERFDLPLSGPETRVVNPPGGSPAALSSLPGSPPDRDRPARDLPGQTAVFRTEPAPRQQVISGVPRTDLTVSSVPGRPSSGDAVLFAKLYDVGPEGQRSLAGSVAPLHVTGLPADGSRVPVQVALPGLVHSLEADHHLELAVSTTDQAYATPDEPAVHRVGLGGGEALSLPSVPGTVSAGNAVPAAPLLGLGGIGLFALLAWVISRIRRNPAADADPDLTATPLVLDRLSKSYPDRSAVHDLSLRVEPGQIVGLLGPNGAGKTTTLRMMLGLLSPSSGQIRVFGHRVLPGSPALSRVGAVVESPGFLPHLSAADNLEYYWAATGRPMPQARFDEVLRIAGLADDAQRPVRTYTQGMKQRLALAQAMLGLPDLLLLDEPTNGLDPPRIQQLREILHRYAASGRSVLMSSHLLSEVEQTCTHVAVMHEGELVTAAEVSEVVASSGEMTFRVDDPEWAAAALSCLEGLGPVEVEQDQIHVQLRGHTAAVVVNVLVGEGLSISHVGPRRRLEDAFLQLVGEEQT